MATTEPTKDKGALPASAEELINRLQAVDMDQVLAEER